METASGPTGLITIFREFFIIGATSFGGGTVAYERSLLTEKRKWCSDDAFNAMLAISQTLPGLNAVNLAILAGDHVRGPGGALAAVSGLLLPGAVFVLAAGLIYLNHDDAVIARWFLAAAAASATGLLLSVVWKLGGERFLMARYLLIAATSFSLLSLTRLPIPVVLLIVVPAAVYLHRPSREGAR